MKALELLLETMLFEHGVKEGHASVRDHYVKRIEELFHERRQEHHCPVHGNQGPVRVWKTRGEDDPGSACCEAVRRVTCTCAEIQRNDPLRHFRECPLRKPLPEGHPQADLHVSVWVVLAEGHRPYVSTVEHTPGYYQALKASGATVVRAEIEIPGYQIDDGKVKSRTVKE